MRRTRLTYVIGSLSRGGSESQLIELLKHIDRTRFLPSLILLVKCATDWAAGLVDECFSLQFDSQPRSKPLFRGAKAAAATLRLAKYLRRTKPDIVHAILPASCILAAPAARLARVPVIIAGRRSMVDCYRRGGMEAWADHIATRACDFVLTNSKSSATEVIEGDGVSRDRVATIYNGVDTERFRPGNRELRKQYGWSDEHIVFGIVANFIPYKRHIDFIRAAALIAKSNPRARFVMVGEDRGILDALSRQIHESGLEQFFTIIPGMRDPERLYPALDVYICTSQSEGLSNVLLEAGACVVPIIATQVGGNPEVVIDGHNGFLVPPATPEAVATKALLLGSNPGLRTLMGERGRQRVAAQFSMAAMVRAHETLYGSLLGREGTAVRPPARVEGVDFA